MGFRDIKIIYKKNNLFYKLEQNNLCGLNSKNHGSILVVVLWILVIISFLSSEYVAHNREKVSITLYAVSSFERETALFSILELAASAQYDFLKAKAQEENPDSESDTVLSKRETKTDKQETDKKNNTKSIQQNLTTPWIRLRPGGIEVWVKIEDESSRIELSLGQENSIRNALLSIYGEKREKEAESFTDAILDWLDSDDLVRLNGAESGYYNGVYPPSDSGNSSFKSMTQLFLVKGFSPELFWGNNYEYILELPIYSELKEGLEQELEESDTQDNGKMQTILDQFTIYGKNYIRVSMLFPNQDGIWNNEILWVNKENGSFKVVEQLSRVMDVNIEQSN